MKYFFQIILLFIFSNVSGQSILMSDANYDLLNPLPCASYNATGIANFYDGAGAANYAANTNDTIVICPNNDVNAAYGNPYSKLILTFATGSGFIWDVHNSDTVFVYDGPSTASPLLGSLNNSTNPIGNVFISSFANTSGCLTIVFKSNAIDQGAGWAASITCFTPAQPFEPHMQAFVNGSLVNELSPADTGYIDVCLGDTIRFEATPIFPFSSTSTGVGYAQTVANSTFQWVASGAGVISNTNVAQFIPTQRQGYLVTLRTTDAFPYSQNIRCKVRVSQLPNFSTAGPLQDTICLGINTVLVGGTTATDTAGVEIPGGSFQLGGAVSGNTFLPDGTGTSYQTIINISGFPVGATYTNPADIAQMCINMEHSYLGDFEILLTCPDGSTESVVNAYSGAGPTPGGFGGGGTFLGNANDTGSSPGGGLSYCFSNTTANFGTMAAEYAANNTIPATGLSAGSTMNPNGIYLPDGTFSNFNGCPINGDWTITVQDNQSIDDGWIFEWSLQFNANLQPVLETYTTTIVNDFWSPSPYIVGGQSDTLINVVIPVTGTQSFQYNITDDFGCDYDTTFLVTVLQLPSIFTPDTTCSLSYPVLGTTSAQGGVWSTTSPNVTFSNLNIANPNITLPGSGTYPVTYTDNACGQSVTSTINVPPPYNFNFAADFFICPGIQEIVTVSNNPLQTVGTYTWTPNVSTTATAILNAGTYNVRVTTTDGCITDTTFTIQDQPKININVVPKICGDSLSFAFNTGSQTGVWSYTGPGIATFDTTINHLTGYVIVDTYGEYNFKYTDSVCGDFDAATVFFNTIQDVILPADLSICLGDPINILATIPSPNLVDSIHWSTNAVNINNINVTDSGTYIVSTINYCGTDYDTIYVTTLDCSFEAPNVFTPNGDTVNGVWKMISLDIKTINVFDLVIVNRWGNTVFETKDATKGWNGKDKSGNPVDDGVYFYKINGQFFNKEFFKKQGFIEVLR
jgi:gliding motility-associated-like protein